MRKHIKYTVLENINFHNFRLDTPTNIRNVFHVDRLRATSMDLFLSPNSDDNHPGPSIVNDFLLLKYDVERILGEKWGRGYVEGK